MINHYVYCPNCKGQGSKKQKLRKSIRLQYERELREYEASNYIIPKPVRPKGHLKTCSVCKGMGLIKSTKYPEPLTEIYPYISIIGGGIGGSALALACSQRGIPFTLYERDKSFNDRAQGYGLTLQQASQAMKALGIIDLNDGIISTRHIVHNTKGEILGEWGMRKWLDANKSTKRKRSNIHIPRQSLRFELIKRIKKENICWNANFESLKKIDKNNIELTLKQNGTKKITKTNLVVGADGIRSKVRDYALDSTTPLHYLNCIVILGICQLNKLKNLNSALLDSETVFQTANGTERMYVMPFSKDNVMWQFSFPMDEMAAKQLSSKGNKVLKAETLRRTKWHSPIPEIIENTDVDSISGYPTYDREPINPNSFKPHSPITLIGDAAHPMSPFKGQGANQALLDALSLARLIHKKCNAYSNWETTGLRKIVLADFETEMAKRTESKVLDSRKAVQILHSDLVLAKSNRPRGKCLED